MSDLDNLVWHREFLAMVKGYSINASQIQSYLKELGFNYTLEQVQQAMKGK